MNEPVGVDGWRVDQILTSDYFDLNSTRGPEYDKLLKKRSILIAKKSLRPKERKELENITEELSQYPSGESPAEMEDKKLIREKIAEFKKSGKVIKI